MKVKPICPACGAALKWGKLHIGNELRYTIECSKCPVIIFDRIHDAATLLPGFEGMFLRQMVEKLQVENIVGLA